MKEYHQFTIKERYRLYSYLQMGKIDEIAIKLNKNRSSIYREIKSKLDKLDQNVLNYSTPAEAFKLHSTYRLSHFKLE